MRQPPLEYFTLVRTTAEGSLLGRFAGQPVFEWVRDQWGRRYRFAGVAPRLASGAFNLALVQKGEWIVEPGLLYRLADAAAA